MHFGGVQYISVVRDAENPQCDKKCHIAALSMGKALQTLVVGMLGIYPSDPTPSHTLHPVGAEKYELVRMISCLDQLSLVPVCKAQ